MITLEHPTMPQAVIDAHHHIWRQNDLAWLQGPSVPRIFGSYDPIKRDYPIEEYLADITGADVVRSVYVQTNWPAGGELDEVAWVHAEAARTGWPHAIVGFADLLDEGAPAVLAAHARHPLVHGIRQQLHWHENPQYRFASRPDLCRNPLLRRNLTLLGERGWPFDLQVFTSQMDDAAALAAAVPDTTFILQHAGMLEDLSDQGWQLWRAGMARLAGQPNIHVKLSGLGTFLHRNDPGHIAAVVGETLQLFGAERCLWGSNFPIEKLWTDYTSLLSAVQAATMELSAADQHGIFFSNAAALYQIE